jgi:hypothetical protein
LNRSPVIGDQAIATLSQGRGEAKRSRRVLRSTRLRSAMGMIKFGFTSETVNPIEIYLF